ncbi:MAG: dephospho-CoA kinase [Micrococcus sp.]|nr:dephospho-CoA kinase [Micrococcus sp.]
MPAAPSTRGADTAPPLLRRLGLTGGIGSGKTTVADMWRDLGVHVIDLDAHSRAVLDVPGEGVEEAIARFGERYRGEGGTVDRQALADLVFADAEARADLEEIVLTRVDAAVRREEEDALAAGEDLVVHDSPLLLEKRHDLAGRYSAVAVVLARREDRIRRVEETRGRDRAYTTKVMAAQVSDLERIHRADRLILNTGDRETLVRRATHALELLRA